MPVNVVLKRGRVKPLLFRHPWVFADAIQRMDGDPEPGEVVRVAAPDGRNLAKGFYCPASRLRVRCFQFVGDTDREADAAWVRDRIERAARFRSDVLGLPSEETCAYRVVHGDADGLPGLVIDRLGTVVSMQITCAGLEALRAEVLDAIEDLFAPELIVERADVALRRREGLEPIELVQRGALPASGVVWVKELGLRYQVPLVNAQKTGFFCDQRENRQRLTEFVGGRRVLDAFCYHGGFGLNAMRAGAESVTCLDSSKLAIEKGRINAEANGLECGFEAVDVFKALGRYRSEGRRFGVTVLDPPKYARARKDLRPALKKYEELFTLGAQVTESGGVMLCCSCSGLVPDVELEGVLRRVSRRIGRDISIFFRGGQAPDHPVRATCPEGRYLRAFFCHVA